MRGTQGTYEAAETEDEEEYGPENDANWAEESRVQRASDVVEVKDEVDAGEEEDERPGDRSLRERGQPTFETDLGGGTRWPKQ